MKNNFVSLAMFLVLWATTVSATIYPLDIYAAPPQQATFVRTGDIISFEYEGTDYHIQIKEITEDYSVGELQTQRKIPRKLNFIVADSKDIDLDGDLQMDITFTITSINLPYSSITATVIPPPPPSPPPPEQPLTTEEKETAQSSLQQFLQIAPHLQQGLLLANGKLTFFSVAQDYAISFALQELAQDDSESAAAIQTFQVLRGMGSALQPAKEGKSQAQPTGAAVFSEEGKVLAAWDGKGMYYNFALISPNSKEINTLFKHASAYARNIQVKKGFADELLTFSILPQGSMDINGKLFLHLEGVMKASELNGVVHYLDAVGRKSPTKVDLTSSPHPLHLTFQKGGTLLYDASARAMAVQRTEARLMEPAYKIIAPALIAETRNANITLYAPATSSYEMLQTEGKAGMNVLVDKKFNVLQLNIFSDMLTLQGKNTLSITTPNTMVSIRNGRTSAKIFSKNEETLIDTKPMVIIKNKAHKVYSSTLMHELNNWRNVLIQTPSSVREFLRNANSNNTTEG